MSTADNQTDNPQRPVLHRLLHTFGEIALGLALGGGSFVGIWALVCYQSTRCEDFKGLAYMIFSFIAAMLICAVFFSFCRRFRNRLKARYRLNAIAGFVTVVVWSVYLLQSL